MEKKLNTILELKKIQRQLEAVKNRLIWVEDELLTLSRNLSEETNSTEH